jgi:hypothetical protein
MNRVLSWFELNRRDLPWRKPEAGPWGVLVSEVMLQQTPVSRVLPVYEYWLSRWPTPAHLATESLIEVLRAWDRMGYPRRAQRLHEAAQIIVSDHGGTVPHELNTRPGPCAALRGVFPRLSWTQMSDGSWPEPREARAKPARPALLPTALRYLPCSRPSLMLRVSVPESLGSWNWEPSCVKPEHQSALHAR